MATAASENVARLYQVLKKHSREVRTDKRLPVPPAYSVTVHSALCGSHLTLDAHIGAGRVREIGYRVRACSLGQTATAIVARRAPGMDAAGLRRIDGQLRAILAGEATHCDWPELEVFALARDIRARHGSVLLPFEALQQIFARSGNSAGSVDPKVDATTPSSRSN